MQRLAVVFVAIDPKGNDRFYVLTWVELRDYLWNGHNIPCCAWRHAGPMGFTTCAILQKYLSPHLNQWQVVKKCLNSIANFYDSLQHHLKGCAVNSAMMPRNRSE